MRGFGPRLKLYRGYNFALFILVKFKIKKRLKYKGVGFGEFAYQDEKQNKKQNKNQQTKRMRQQQLNVSENAPAWIKSLPWRSQKVVGCLLQKYFAEFAFGLNGARGKRVDLDVDGEDMEPILAQLAFKVSQGALGKEGRDIFFQKLTKYTMEWKTEEEVRALFSSLELEHTPKFERVYAEDSKDKSKFRELTDAEVDNLYHSKQNEQDWKSLFESFPSGDCNVKRIKLAIGEVPGRCVPFSLKLTYFKNVIKQFGTGILRLSFTFHTYENERVKFGIVCHPKENQERSRKRERFEPKLPELTKEEEEELLAEQRRANEYHMKKFGRKIYKDVD